MPCKGSNITVAIQEISAESLLTDWENSNVCFLHINMGNVIIRRHAMSNRKEENIDIK